MKYYTVNIRLMEALSTAKPLTLIDRNVLSYILSFKKTHASNPTIAGDIGLSIATLKRSLKRLEQRQLISTTHKGSAGGKTLRTVKVTAKLLSLQAKVNQCDNPSGDEPAQSEPVESSEPAQSEPLPAQSEPPTGSERAGNRLRVSHNIDNYNYTCSNSDSERGTASTHTQSDIQGKAGSELMTPEVQQALQLVRKKDPRYSDIQLQALLMEARSTGTTSEQLRTCLLHFAQGRTNRVRLDSHTWSSVQQRGFQRQKTGNQPVERTEEWWEQKRAEARADDIASGRLKPNGDRWSEEELKQMKNSDVNQFAASLLSSIC